MIRKTRSLYMISSRINKYKKVAVLLFPIVVITTFWQAKPQDNQAVSDEHIDIVSHQAPEQIRKSEQAVSTPEPTPNTDTAASPKIIEKIIISGNKLVDTNAILNRIPYKIGEEFDARKTRTLIHNLYDELKRFRNIQVMGELVGDDGINLHVIVDEKKILKEIEFLPKKRGISDTELEKIINISDIPAIDKEELKRLEKQIKKLCMDKSFNNAVVTSELQLDEDGKYRAIFKIQEGKKSRVKRILFKGNEHISGKELRKKLFTKEDWVFGFLDNSGSLQPDRLEADKHVIEQYYQSNGYLKAKVTNVDVGMDKDSKNFTITFEIQEGPVYTVKEVRIPGQDILKDEYLVRRIPIKPGDLYSRQKILDAIKALEFIWGELGYIYAHIEPSIQPDDDNKTVDIAFYSELGNKVFLNKINIIGNKKTKDKVIRRKLALREGDLLTNKRMDASKYNVESLGYFDRRDGVNWQTTRIDDEHADLDLILKEAKTGHAGIKIGFGGSVESLQAVNSGFSVSGEVTDTNLFGTGIALNLNATLAKGEQSIVFNITDPWLFDKPITGALDIYHRRPTYGEFRNVSPVTEKNTGGGVTVGFVSPRLRNTQLLFRLGGDRIRYERQPQILMLPPGCRDARADYQAILCNLFEPGSYFWFETSLGADRKNHPMHPSRGYKWLAASKLGFPSFDCNVGYFKMDLDLNWYTPIIGEHDLVLRLHGYFGLVANFKNRFIPYRELFHIGGPASVRGFLFGQVGPNFCGDSLGGKKAFFVNAELHFPITQDFNIKGVLFYDGGSGWDNPFAGCSPRVCIENNSFNFRHAVGVGFRMLSPAPIRVDWGFKLDRRKKLGETPYEVHFGMTYDW